MVTARILVLLLAGWMAGQAIPPPDEPPGPPEPAAGRPPAPARVVLRLSRDTEILGTVELEDDDVVVLRDLEGQVVSFAKARVLKIIPLVEPQAGQMGTVELRDGQRRRGVIHEDSFERVVIEVEGIRITFKRRDVEQVTLEPTWDQRYAQLKSVLEPQMHGEHLELCRWLLELRQYEICRTELLELLNRKRDFEAAREMLRLVDAQLALEPGDGDDAAPTGAPADEQRPGPDDHEQLLPERIISLRDVNTMRVYEIDFDDPPKVQVGPQTIRRMLERYGANDALPRGADERTALFRADPLEIVALLFRLQARDLYPEIQVLTEPRSLNLFRQRVHNTWLLNNCATSRCHGGPGAGRLQLIRSAARHERVRCTNLLILERLDIDPQWPLINYESPIDSLIIQHGMPRQAARKPHPDVRGWTPVFTDSNHRMLEGSIQWIEAMLRPRPEYPVQYEPEGLGPEETGPDHGDRRSR